MEIPHGEHIFNDVWRVDVYEDEAGLFHRGLSNERLPIIPQQNGQYVFLKMKNCTISHPLPPMRKNRP